MGLADELARARTEEDVKDAWIAVLALRDYSKGLVDIRTDKVWFEAKDSPTAPLIMFAQLLVYVRAARLRGEPIPPFLSAIDREKGLIMPTAAALPALDDPALVWPASASAAGRELAAQLAPYIGDCYTTYPVATLADAFCDAITAAIRDGEIIRTPITPDNLRQVFDRWIDMIGSELDVTNPADYAVLFFADIMHDGRREAMKQPAGARLLFSGEKPVFLLGSEQYELANYRGYRNFWAIYHRPPEVEHRHYLLERRDSLLPLDEQKFKGAYYTPLHIVDKAYDELKATLGDNWQDRYIVWDMCAGVGNLEAKHSNLRNVFMSTLDLADVTIMKSNPAFSGATIFQYDYLSDDVTDFGVVDYRLSNRLPAALREAIADFKAGVAGTKPILVLINPPYGEAANSQGNAGKTGIATTRISHGMGDLGYAGRELFVQFLHRIMIEMPAAKLGVVSKLKYINAPNFELFRNRWRAKFLSGFIISSKVFDSLKGSYPIGFLIWDLASNQLGDLVETTALDRLGNPIGQKTFFNVPKSLFLSSWMDRLKTQSTIVPLKNAISPQIAHAKVTSWHDGSIGYLLANSNDLQNAGGLTSLFSSVYSAGNGYYVTSDNLWRAAIVFAVRRLIKPTWLNDRDQFLQPTQPLSEEFKADCLVWMLFNGSNLTAGADGLNWNGRDWSLVNHFIPFTEREVGASGRFESDLMVRHMAGMTLSPEARAVLDAGRVLWTRYHTTHFPRRIRDELKLNRPDAGWYQVRRALKAYGETDLADFEPLEFAYSLLSAKLRPMVFSLGFLPE